MSQFNINNKWILALVFILVCNAYSLNLNVQTRSSTGDESLPSLDPELQLQLVQLLFRHGDRNPIDPYPNDPYRNESNWAEGYGQLTKRGKMQHYRLGQYLRKRYDGFISKRYSPYEVLVQSSDVDRALMSASTNLAGLFPPVDDVGLWNKNLSWQPIPIHSISSQLDNELRLNESCPRYDELRREFRSSDIMRQVNDENKDLYDTLTLHSGRNIHDPQQVDYLYDILLIETLYNKELQSWAQKVVKDPRVLNLTAFSFKMITYTEEMKRLKGGPLIKEMIKNMNDRISGKLDVRRKLFMYSAHDTTVSTFLNSLDLYEMIPPPYASLVLLELFKNETSGTYFVRLGYKNTTGDPYVLTLPGCNQLCPMPSFVQITKPVVPEDWTAECQKEGFIKILGGSTFGLLTGGLLVIMLVLVIPIMVCIRCRRFSDAPPKYPYLHLQMDDEEA